MEFEECKAHISFACDKWENRIETLISSFTAAKEKCDFLVNVDMDVLINCKDLVSDFERSLNDFKTLFASKFKFLRQKNSDLQHKYEHVTLRTKA